MAWWQGGYQEFHDCADELDFASRFERQERLRCSGPARPPQPAEVVFGCPSCSSAFNGYGQLVEHAKVHVSAAPQLLLDGRRTPVSLRIEEPVAASRWSSLHAESAHLNARSVAVGSIGPAIAESAAGRQVLELRGNGITTRVELDLRLVREDDLAQVDTALHDLILTRELNVDAIERLVREAGPRTSAAHYLDGIVAYLYWALRREGAITARPHDPVGSRQLNRAIEELRVFDRWYARAIRSLAAFQLNQFERAASLAVDDRLRAAAGFFRDLLAGEEADQLGGGWEVGQHASATFSDVGVESQLTAVNRAELVIPTAPLDQTSWTQRDELRELLLRAELHRRHGEDADLASTLERLRWLDSSRPWADLLGRRPDEPG